jgi:spore germination protein GerM
VTGRPRRPAVLALLVVATVVTAACGIPIGRSPTPIAKAGVPFHLLDPVTPTTATTDLPPEELVQETIYLVAQSQHVVGVSRYVRFPASLTQVLGALLEGPTSTESTTGLQSFLPPHTTVTATVTGDIATVNFTSNPITLVGADLTLAIAQVVFTATQPPSGVKGVVFEIAGLPITVPAGNGTQVSGPVSRSTYAPQAPLTAPA